MLYVVGHSCLALVWHKYRNVNQKKIIGSNRPDKILVFGIFELYFINQAK
jgi:hypothetical protein